MVCEVQSVIFAWQYWSTTRAQKWLHKHWFVWNSKVDIPLVELDLFEQRSVPMDIIPNN